MSELLPHWVSTHGFFKFFIICTMWLIYLRTLPCFDDFTIIFTVNHLIFLCVQAYSVTLQVYDEEKIAKACIWGPGLFFDGPLIFFCSQ